MSEQQPVVFGRSYRFRYPVAGGRFSVVHWVTFHYAGLVDGRWELFGQDHIGKVRAYSFDNITDLEEVPKGTWVAEWMPCRNTGVT